MVYFGFYFLKPLDVLKIVCGFKHVHGFRLDVAGNVGLAVLGHTVLKKVGLALQ